MMDQPTPVLALTEETTESFVPDGAGYFAEPETNEMFSPSEDGTVIVVIGRDANNRLCTIEYHLSEVLVDIAEYENPKVATATTAPTSIERCQAYGKDVDDPSLLSLQNGPYTSTRECISELYDEAIIVEPQEDFIVATSYDYASPIPNEVSVYWVAAKGYYTLQPETPFFVHHQYETVQSNTPRTE